MLTPWTRGGRAAGHKRRPRASVTGGVRAGFPAVALGLALLAGCVSDDAAEAGRGCRRPPTTDAAVTGSAPPEAPREELERFEYEAETGRISALRAAAWRTPALAEARPPRVVYVHGSPGDASAFAAYLRRPVRGLPCVSIDRPGFGRSEPDEAVPSLVEQAAALEPLLVDRPVLVGHSLGAPIAALAAALWPDRVGGLVLLAGALDPELEELHWYNRLGQALDPVLPDDLARSNEEMLALEDELRLLAPRLERITCPVVVVHGTEDRLVPYGNVDYVRARFVRAPVTVHGLEGVDHFFIWQAEHVPLVRRVVGELLDERGL